MSKKRSQLFKTKKSKKATAAKKALKKVKKKAKETNQDTILVKTPHDATDVDESLEL